MAKLPVPAPKWMTTVYRGDEAAWEAAKTQCRGVLYEWAAEGKPHTYSELASRVPAILWPEGAHTDEGSQVGFLLGQVALEELSHVDDRPIISALVIDKVISMPSGGFWTLCTELGLNIGKSDLDRLKFWTAEFDACCLVYGGRSAAR